MFNRSDLVYYFVVGKSTVCFSAKGSANMLVYPLALRTRFNLKQTTLPHLQTATTSFNCLYTLAFLTLFPEM